MTGVESLYPFLYAGDSARMRAEMFAEVVESTKAKLAESERVRAELVRVDAHRIAGCAAAMAARFAAGGQLFSFGNGGSSTDADAVAELFVRPGPAASGPRPRRLPARSLTADVATLTALANDVSFDVVFARPLAAAGGAGDIAFGLSTSGSSTNVLAGLAEAHRIGMLTVGLAGYSGGAMAEARDRGQIDHLFVMPSDSVHRIQEAQTTTYQVLWELVQLALGR
ncbi:MAG TPA: SIS domain-containing protein [Pseudonocardia sp.]